MGHAPGEDAWARLEAAENELRAHARVLAVALGDLATLEARVDALTAERAPPIGSRAGAGDPLDFHAYYEIEHRAGQDALWLVRGEADAPYRSVEEARARAEQVVVTLGGQARIVHVIRTVVE